MRDNLVHLEIISQAIETYIADIDEDLFLRNNMLKDACLMQLIVIGDNGSKVSQEVRDRFGEVEWQLMRAARNFFAHAYERTDWTTVWETIKADLSGLKKKIKNILEILEGEKNAKTN